MEHLIGQRFALVSKSEIRYVGTLHEINPEESTITLQDVRSYGTEDRRVERYIPPSQAVYEHIKFRGSDVKDIKVMGDDEPTQPQSHNIPDDPAIMNSSRPPQQPPAGPQDRRESPYPPPGYPPQGYPGYHPQHFGRGYGPPPPGGFGPGPGFPPYGPPPPGYFGPPGQGFPPNQFQGPPPPAIGHPGQYNTPQQPPGQPQGAPPVSQPTQELPVDNKDAATKPAKSPAPPTQPQSTVPAQAPTTIPTGPKAVPKGKVAPAMPFTVNQKSFTPPVQPEAPQAPAKQTQSKAEMDEAAIKAKEAVQAALAKLPGSTQPKPAPVPTATSIEALTEKVSEMGPTSNGAGRGRGARGQHGDYSRGRSGGHAGRKIEIPKSDYDFETANKKFNKEDLIKEAIASGSPVAEDGPTNGVESISDSLERKDSIPGASKAYNKSSSFFDNISSEAKDRGENPDARQHGRQARAEEFKRNVDTFGQGNVDGGYRGRGRGGYRGRQYGGNRGYRGNYGRGYGGRGGRPAPDPSAGSNAPPTATPTLS